MTFGDKGHEKRTRAAAGATSFGSDARTVHIAGLKVFRIGGLSGLSERLACERSADLVYGSAGMVFVSGLLSIS